MIKVIPAIIADSIEEVDTKTKLVSHYVKRVQLDAIDGLYAGKAHWPYLKGGEYDESFQDMVSEERPMPRWESVDFEIDLMVKNPIVAANDWLSAGAMALIFHVESLDGFELEMENFCNDFSKNMASELGVEIGLAIRPSTPNDEIEKYVRFANFIQCMGNDVVGEIGVDLDEKVYKKISSLHYTYPDISIGVDIGVNLDTASSLVEAGADRLVSGSAIFESKNIGETIALLGGKDY